MRRDGEISVCSRDPGSTGQIDLSASQGCSGTDCSGAFIYYRPLPSLDHHLLILLCLIQRWPIRAFLTYGKVRLAIGADSDHSDLLACHRDRPKGHRRGHEPELCRSVQAVSKLFGLLYDGSKVCGLSVALTTMPQLCLTCALSFRR